MVPGKLKLTDSWRRIEPGGEIIGLIWDNDSRSGGVGEIHDGEEVVRQYPLHPGKTTVVEETSGASGPFYARSTIPAGVFLSVRCWNGTREYWLEGD